MTDLHPRFSATLRMMREAAHQGERDIAQSRLVEFARRVGLTLEQAIAQHEHVARPKQAPEPITWYPPDTVPRDGTPVLLRLRDPISQSDLAGDPAEDVPVVVGWWNRHGFEAFLILGSEDPNNPRMFFRSTVITPTMWAPIPVGGLAGVP